MFEGKSDPYCEVSMGAQEHKTKVISSTLNPKWNASMQFTIRDLQEDVLCITVYDRDLFTPNGRQAFNCFQLWWHVTFNFGPIGLIGRNQVWKVEGLITEK